MHRQGQRQPGAAQLVAAGVIETVDHPDDKRHNLHRLSKKGGKALAGIESDADGFMQAALAQLDDDELASTTAAMKKMTAALRSARKQRDANLRVRPIAARDDAAMAAIIRDVFREYGMDKMEGVSLHDPDLDRLTGLYRDNGGHYWVLERDGQVVGASAWRRWRAKSPAIASCKSCSSNPARVGWAWRAIWWCRR